MSVTTNYKTVGDLINGYEQAYRANGTLGMAEVLLENIRVMDSLNCDTSIQVRIISQQIDCLISAQNHIVSSEFAEIAKVNGELLPDNLPFPEVANG